MKTYIVYVNGNVVGTIKAASHNAAEKKAKAKHAGCDCKKFCGCGAHVSVEYTEV